MYIEEIVSKRSGKEYRTVLIRESFRNGKKVQHRTIANISQLPPGCVQEIKRYLQGKPAGIDLSDIEVLESKEYAASECIISVAKKLELKSSTMAKGKKDNIQALVVAKMLYGGNEPDLINLHSKSTLWKSCGHCKTPPDLCKHCHKLLEHLFLKQDSIQKKLIEKHIKNEKNVLLYITSLKVEGINENFTTLENLKIDYQNIQVGIFTNLKGCPLVVKVLSFDGLEPESIKNCMNQHKLENLFFISNNEIPEDKLQEIAEQGFNTIMRLPKDQMQSLIDDGVISKKLFLTDQLVEIPHSKNPFSRYILYVDNKKKSENFYSRAEHIKQTIKMLKALQKEKILDERKLSSEVANIFKICDTERFFSIDIKNSDLNFSLNNEKIEEDQQMDGCFVIQTDVEKELMPSSEIVTAYKNLKSIKKDFNLIKTVSCDKCCTSLNLNERIRAHIMISMLASYLRWHIIKKLNAHFKNGKQEVTLTSTKALESLKSIRSQTIRFGNTIINDVKSALDNEQKEIISALGATLTLGL